MIRSIWLSIAALLALAVIPLTFMQFKLQRETVVLLYDIMEKTSVHSIVDQYLDQLKEDARKSPEKEQELKLKFADAAHIKQKFEEFLLVKDSIGQDLQWQAAVLTGLVLGMALLISFFISRSIVKKYERLAKERDKALAKENEISSLQKWQNTARMLVHELRAPITPIKLIASDVSTKFDELESQNFRTYLQQAQDLVLTQITTIESMINTFTEFGKLQAPQKVPFSLQKFLDNFVTLYQHSFGPDFSLQYLSRLSKDNFSFDPKLISDLLFNLIKNASEANNGKTSVSITAKNQAHNMVILVHNTGKKISGEFKSRLFEPHFSLDKPLDGHNMGLGLTIAKKIALDHGGNLTLVDSRDSSGATFCLELPY